jgi:4-hydroxy-tetrahydrodipicolinate reductase
MARFALEAAKHLRDVEIIDYAGPNKVDTPSGTARELAEMLGHVRMPASSRPVSRLTGIKETRGGQVGIPNGVHIHSIRMPSYVLSCEVVMGAESERLSIRHDSGSSAAPYVAGTLLAARHVREFIGLKRGLAAVM